MRRLCAILVLCALSGPALAVSDPAEMLPNPVQENRAEAIGRTLRCLVCQNESIEDSRADLAHDLRTIVRQRVSAGDTDADVVAWMVARYGDFVRLSPPFNALTAALWLSPLLAVGAGIAAAMLGRRRSRVVAAVPLSAGEAARLAELMGR